jgi:Flp pilus assembly pilin Flp
MARQGDGPQLRLRAITLSRLPGTVRHRPNAVTLGAHATQETHRECRQLHCRAFCPAYGNRERDRMNLFVLKTWLQSRFCKDERGANLVEYILLVALIALAVIAAVVFLRGQVSSKFDTTGSTLSGS